jgi:uncharacterized protein (TIGR02646 family)
MIHVTPQPEPETFDAVVRQMGLALLRKRHITLDQPLPANTSIEPYWRHCLDAMYTLYEGYCAYLAIFFERVTGGGTVDHFVAKSQRADLSYEWSNYRLACSRMNSRKREYNDVLDPFEIETGWFHVELVSGRVFPNPDLPPDRQDAVQATIDRLGLDDSGNREMRARHYQEYRQNLYTADFLKKRSPFVWAEATRQGLL